MKLSELRKLYRSWLSGYKDNIISSDWKDYAHMHIAFRQARRQSRELQEKNSRLETLLSALIKQMKNPAYRGYHTQNQMCALLDGWIDMIESELNRPY